MLKLNHVSLLLATAMVFGSTPLAIPVSAKPEVFRVRDAVPSRADWDEDDRSRARIARPSKDDRVVILPNGDTVRIDDDEDRDRFRSRRPRPKIIRLPNSDRVVKMPSGDMFRIDDD